MITKTQHMVDEEPIDVVKINGPYDLLAFLLGDDVTQDEVDAEIFIDEFEEQRRDDIDQGFKRLTPTKDGPFYKYLEKLGPIRHANNPDDPLWFV